MKPLVKFVFAVALIAGTAEAEQGSVRDWAEALKAQGEYLKLLSEAQLNYAKAQLVDAQASKELAKVKQLNLLVNRLELQLKRLARDEHKLRAKIDRIEEYSIRVNTILSGRISQNALRALGYLQIHAIPPEVTLQAMKVPVIGNIDGELIADAGEGASFDGENVGQLLAHLKKHRMEVEPWGYAHQQIVEALSRLSDAAQERVGVYRDEMGKIAQASDPFLLTIPFPESPQPRP